MSTSGFVKDLFAGDFKKIGNYIYHDVLIPAVKKLLWDAGSGAWHTLIYENPSNGAPGGNNGSGFGMRYWNGSQPPQKNQERGSQPYTIMAREYAPQAAQKQTVGMVGSNRFNNLTFRTKEEATDLINRLKDKLYNKQARGENGVYVTVADMLNEYQRMFDGEVQIRSEFTCNDYGWSNLDEARATLNDTGWYVAWPEPSAISNLVKK